MDVIDYRDSGELSDIRILVDDKEFNLHKFPLFVRSNYFKNHATKTALSEHKDKLTIRLDAFPGGAKTFALIADYCYNKEIHVDSTNIIDVKCAAEYLEMNSNGKGGLCMFVDNILFDILYIAKTKRNFKIILQLIEESIKQKEVVERCKLNLRLLDAFIDFISLSIKLHSSYNIRQNELLGKDELKVIYNLPLTWFVYIIKSKVHTSSYTGLLSALVEIYIDYNTNLNPNFNANSQLIQPLLQPLQVDVQSTGDVKTSSPAVSPIAPLNLNSNSNDDLNNIQATSSQFMDSPAVRSKNFSDNEKLEIIREIAVAFNEAYYENQLSLTWLLTYLNVLNSFNADNNLKAIFLKWIWLSFNGLRKSTDELNDLPVDVMVLLVKDIVSREDPTGLNLERIINLTDHYLTELEKNKKLTPDVFIQVAQTIPKEKRQSFDNLMVVLLEMLRKDCFSINQQKQQELLDLIDFHKLTETTLELCKNSEDTIPQKYITEAALALCSKLRKELDDYKILCKSLETRAYPSTTTTKTTTQLLADLNLYKPASATSTFTSSSLAAASPLLTKYQQPSLKSASSSNLYRSTTTTIKPSTPSLTRKPLTPTVSTRRTTSIDRLANTNNNHNNNNTKTQIVLSSDDDDVSSLDDDSLCNYHRSKFYDELLHSRNYYYSPTSSTQQYRPTYSLYYDSLRF